MGSKMTTPKVKMRRYRAAMKRAGFKHISFWLHAGDIEVARATVGQLAELRRLAELAEILREGTT